MKNWLKRKKQGAVPRPPRSSNSSNSSNSENIPPRQGSSSLNHEQEEVFVEPENLKETEDIKTEEYTPPPKNGEKNNYYEKENKSKPNKSEQHKNGTIYYVNTQAHGGEVTNIFNGKHIHVGHRINICLVDDVKKQPKSEDRPVGPEINLLLEAEIKPNYNHLTYVSQHLGRNWYNIFMELGFTEDEIATKENSELIAKYGVKDVCFKLLLEWVRKDDENTLGRLAKFLWDVNERVIVKELAKMYNGGL